MPKFDDLVPAAERLNKVSDELNAHIKEIETAVSRLNLGIEAFVPFKCGVEEFAFCYGRNNQHKWGFIIRGQQKLWMFSDAPRYLRIRAVDFLPALLEQLIVVAKDTTDRLRTAADELERANKLISEL